MVQNKQYDFGQRTAPMPGPVPTPVAALPVSRGPPSNTPVASWKAGALQVAVWENAAQSPEGTVQSYHSVSFERRYKDKSGVWQSTNSLRVNDLPKAALLLNKAYEYLILGGEHDE